jgi:hypothetical protein
MGFHVHAGVDDVLCVPTCGAPASPASLDARGSLHLQPQQDVKVSKPILSGAGEGHGHVWSLAHSAAQTWT